MEEGRKSYNGLRMVSPEQLLFHLPLFIRLFYIHLCRISAQIQLVYLCNGWDIFPNFCFDKSGFWIPSNTFSVHGCISYFLLTAKLFIPITWLSKQFYLSCTWKQSQR